MAREGLTETVVPGSEGFRLPTELQGMIVDAALDVPSLCQLQLVYTNTFCDGSTRLLPTTEIPDVHCSVDLNVQRFIHSDTGAISRDANLSGHRNGKTVRLLCQKTDTLADLTYTRVGSTFVALDCSASAVRDLTLYPPEQEPRQNVMFNPKSDLLCLQIGQYYKIQRPQDPSKHLFRRYPQLADITALALDTESTWNWDDYGATRMCYLQEWLAHFPKLETIYNLDFHVEVPEHVARDTNRVTFQGYNCKFIEVKLRTEALLDTIAQRKAASLWFLQHLNDMGRIRMNLPLLEIKLLACVRDRV